MRCKSTIKFRISLFGYSRIFWRGLLRQNKKSVVCVIPKPGFCALLTLCLVGLNPLMARATKSLGVPLVITSILMPSRKKVRAFYARLRRVRVVERPLKAPATAFLAGEFVPQANVEREPSVSRTAFDLEAVQVEAPKKINFILISTLPQDYTSHERVQSCVSVFQILLNRPSPIS